MSDEEKVELVTMLVDATAAAAWAQGGSKTKNKREERLVRKVLTELLGRRATDAEVDEVL